MVDRQRHGRLLIARKRPQRRQAASAQRGIRRQRRDAAADGRGGGGAAGHQRRAGGRQPAAHRWTNVDFAQVVWLTAILGFDFENQAVLIQLREHDRDLALAEGVVQHVVDHLRRDTQPRRRVPVDHHAGLQPLEQLVAGHVAQLRQALELAHELWSPFGQFLRVGIFETVLILRAADACFHSQVLHRLHEQRDAFHARQARLQAANHVAGRLVAFFQRLQVDLNAPAVHRRVRAVDPDKAGQAVHRRIFEDGLVQLELLQLRHGGSNETSCGPSEMPMITPVSCTGKNPLGTITYR